VRDEVPGRFRPRLKNDREGPASRDAGTACQPRQRGFMRAV